MESKTIPDTGDNPILWTLYRLAFPIAWSCHRLGMSANLVSGASLLSSILSVILLVGFQSQLCFVVLWTLAVVLDFADGTVARMSRRSNQTAFKLDHTLDLVKISAGCVGLAAYWNVMQLWALSMLTLASMLIFTVLNHDLGHAHGLVEPSTTDRKPRRSRFRNGLMLTFLTFHAGSLLLLGLAAVQLTIAYVVFAYLLILCVALALWCALRLRRLPKPR